MGATPAVGREVAVEIVIQDLAGARIAAAHQVDRVELCAALGTTGGLTPSLALIEAAVSQGVAVHPLIRPRSGDFVYSPDDVAITERDIAHAVAAGCAGVVVGALHPDHTLDIPTLSRFIAAAGGAEVTVHRAVDVVLAERPDAGELIDALAELGVRRILTSGGAPNAGAGVGLLGELAEASSGRVQIMAGGGVQLANIPALVAAGVDAIHLSAKKPHLGGAAGPGGGQQSYEVTDAELVGQVVRLVRTGAA